MSITPQAKILLVDDQPANLVALEAILEPLGQHLVRAASGGEALKQLLLHDEFAVILLDVQMPGMDGFETAAAIKGRERSRHIPLIFLTAINKEDRFVYQGYSAGAVDYLFKLLDAEIVRSKVAVFVELFRRGEQIKEQATLLAEARLRDAERECALRERAVLRSVLESVTEGRLRLCEAESELPAPLPRIGEPLALSRPSLQLFRRHVEAVACERDLSDERRYDLLTTVGEASMNAVVHAGGGEARVCADADTIQIWIEDRGAGIAMDSLHRATLERGFTTAGSLGHGFWMILRTVDRLYLLTGHRGTVLVIEQEREEPEPPWLRGVRAEKLDALP